MRNTLFSHTPFSVRGTIVAGWPSPAEEELGDTITLQEWLVPHKESSWLVKISTNIMKESGILIGDMAIVERGVEPKHGDIVIAQIDQITVIRLYEKQSGKPVLVAKNYVYAGEEIKIFGVVTAIIRKYR